MKIFTKKSLIIPLLWVLLNCQEKKNNAQKILLSANQKLAYLEKIEKTFEIYGDSSYLFTETIHEINHNKTENWEGRVQIMNDTIKFFPFRLAYNQSEVAVLKNGFIEFINGQSFEKLKIQQTSLFVNNSIDFTNFKDYAVFPIQTDIDSSTNKQNLQSYDLTTKELSRIDTILKQDFQKNPNLREFSNYIKQVEAVRNTQGNIIAFIHCFCKDKHRDEIYQYYPTSMMDGGNCNVFIKLNLTTNKIEILTIAGEA